MWQDLEAAHRPLEHCAYGVPISFVEAGSLKASFSLGLPAQAPEPEPVVLVISGPSGVGKDAVLRRLQELRPDLYFVVTATSRHELCWPSSHVSAAPITGLARSQATCVCGTRAATSELPCRAMRAGEVDGRDYIFVSRATFEEWISQGQLLEHALVYGDYKGIPRDQGPVCWVALLWC